MGGMILCLFFIMLGSGSFEGVSEHFIFMYYSTFSVCFVLFFSLLIFLISVHIYRPEEEDSSDIEVPYEPISQDDFSLELN